jgi:hypothetical protein
VRGLRVLGSRSVGALALTGAALAGGCAGGQATDTAGDRTATVGLRPTCVWRTVPTVDPRPRLVDELRSVAAVSPHEAWAVGDFYAGEAGPEGNFIDRWNGRRWTRSTAGVPREARPEAVAAAGPGEAWVVGERGAGAQLIERWEGSRWNVISAPQVPRSELFAVAARAGGAWAVGAHGNGVVRTLIERWDGRRWRVVPSPSPAASPGRPPFAVLQAVTTISATDAWAVGTVGGTARSPAQRTLIEHWNGSRWSVVPSPNVRAANGVTDDWLFSISAGGPDDVWAVGSWGSQRSSYGGKGDHALALHWDGHRWSRIPTPPIPQGSLLFGVAAREGHAWAVGSRGDFAGAGTLIEYWNGARWAAAPSPHGLWFSSVAVSSAGDAWAVGQRGRRPLAARCRSTRRRAPR